LDRLLCPFRKTDFKSNLTLQYQLCHVRFASYISRQCEIFNYDKWVV